MQNQPSGFEEFERLLIRFCIDRLLRCYPIFFLPRLNGLPDVPIYPASIKPHTISQDHITDKNPRSWAHLVEIGVSEDTCGD